MDILGVVEEISADGRLIVRCDNLPELGDRVCDASNKDVGVVGRIMGPVDTPYASVNPERGKAGIGDKLFIVRRKANAKGKRRNRGN